MTSELTIRTKLNLVKKKIEIVENGLPAMKQQIDELEKSGCLMTQLYLLQIYTARQEILRTLLREAIDLSNKLIEILIVQEEEYNAALVPNEEDEEQ